MYIEEKKARLSAINSKPKIGNKYSFSLEWKLFAYRITKHPFIKKKLTEKQGSCCVVCNRQLNNDKRHHIHHLNYDHVCRLGSVIKFFTGRISKKNNPRFKEIPDCECCFTNNRDYYESCIKNLAYVHTVCHGTLHNDLKRKLNHYRLKNLGN